MSITNGHLYWRLIAAQATNTLYNMQESLKFTSLHFLSRIVVFLARALIVLRIVHLSLMTIYLFCKYICLFHEMCFICFMSVFKQQMIFTQILIF